MTVADLIRDAGTKRAVAYAYANRHDYFAELEQLAWRRAEDQAGIEAGDIARLLLRAYAAEAYNPATLPDHVLNLPRWRTFPLGEAE